MPCGLKWNPDGAGNISQCRVIGRRVTRRGRVLVSGIRLIAYALVVGLNQRYMHRPAPGTPIGRNRPCGHLTSWEWVRNLRDNLNRLLLRSLVPGTVRVCQRPMKTSPCHGRVYQKKIQFPRAIGCLPCRTKSEGKERAMEQKCKKMSAEPKVHIGHKQEMTNVLSCGRSKANPPTSATVTEFTLDITYTFCFMRTLGCFRGWRVGSRLLHVLHLKRCTSNL